MAQSFRTGETVAIKRQSVVDLVGLGMALNEASLLRAFRSNYIVGFRDVFLDRETMSVDLVMEYAGGCSLATLVAIEHLRRRLSLNLLGFILKSVTSGLRVLHERSIIHNDLHMQNILLTFAGEVKVADLGLATTPGHKGVPGNEHVMPPEVYHPGAPGIDVSLDIWSLGLVAWKCSTGETLVEQEAPSDLEAVLFNLQMAVQRVRRLGNAHPAHQFIKACLDWDPRRRLPAKDLLGLPLLTDVAGTAELRPLVRLASWRSR